jgi:hypothetical protein
MCKHAPHTFTDIFEETAPADRPELLQHLQAAEKLLGGYHMDEAGEAVVVYRLHTGKGPQDMGDLHRMVRHYWSCICARVVSLGIEYAESCAEAGVGGDAATRGKLVLGELSNVDRMVVWMANQESDGAASSFLVDLFFDGPRTFDYLENHAFRVSAEVYGVN